MKSKARFFVGPDTEPFEIAKGLQLQGSPACGPQGGCGSSQEGTGGHCGKPGKQEGPGFGVGSTWACS